MLAAVVWVGGGVATNTHKQAASRWSGMLASWVQDNDEHHSQVLHLCSGRHLGRTYATAYKLKTLHKGNGKVSDDKDDKYTFMIMQMMAS